MELTFKWNFSRNRLETKINIEKLSREQGPNFDVPKMPRPKSGQILQNSTDEQKEKDAMEGPF